MTKLEEMFGNAERRPLAMKDGIIYGADGDAIVDIGYYGIGMTTAKLLVYCYNNFEAVVKQMEGIRDNMLDDDLTSDDLGDKADEYMEGMKRFQNVE